MVSADMQNRVKRLHHEALQGSFTNCNSTHLVYMITCTQCNLQYIGCTIRKRNARIREHIQVIQIPAESRRNTSNVSKHYRDVHGNNTDTFQAMGIEKVSKQNRGGDWQRKGYMREGLTGSYK